MYHRPDMIPQFAHHLADQLPVEGAEPVEIRVEARISLNGRKRQPLIDESVNLAREPRNLRHASWIIPLTEPLPPFDDR